MATTPQTPTTEQTRWILSLDGGGIRGRLTSSFLVEIERQTGRKLRDIFSFVAGTSTGALIAAAIAAGVPAVAIKEIYSKRSHEIFNHDAFDADFLKATRGYAYDPANIRRVLLSEFGAAGSWTMNDCPLKVLITAVAVSKRPLYFVPDCDQNAHRWGHKPLVDCAIASACAPTYFDAWHVPGCGYVYDGGIGTTGNPCYRALVEAFFYDDWKPETTKMLSLGTGFYPNPTDDEHVPKPVGLPGVLKWVAGTAIGAPNGEQTELVYRHYPGVMNRMDWPMPHNIDMAEIDAIPQLGEIGDALAAKTDFSFLPGGKAAA